MSKEAMIELSNVDVSFLVQRYGFSSIKQYFVSLGSKKLFERKPILHGIDLSIQRGECFGMIGKNGSGKSTLLRVMSGIIKPSRGTVDVRGAVAPMLALGIGLEPEMSGLENIRLCSAFMGVSVRNTNKAFEKILDFSELTQEEMEMQVKRYSTGMMARLGFAIATVYDPEILLIDEVLAVGDVGFQNKCYKRINEIREQGSTVVFVSHFLSEIQKICTRAACMDKGRIVKVGSVHEVGQYYNSLFEDPEVVHAR